MAEVCQRVRRSTMYGTTRAVHTNIKTSSQQCNTVAGVSGFGFLLPLGLDSSIIKTETEFKKLSNLSCRVMSEWSHTLLLYCMKCQHAFLFLVFHRGKLLGIQLPKLSSIYRFFFLTRLFHPTKMITFRLFPAYTGLC